ncbi:MAG: chemotaxis response regulator protein-glutamate methylesterase [Bacillota bacterium]|jgi:two-component system chemotaxis response regulator CheB|nr:chemotaxis response regulator protein-glutamate methylesterase [Bacillota bacterium]NLV63186.1 chemotaxis response regulator protein-glutamate methylesterase [Clostridiaceae bacterium]
MIKSSNIIRVLIVDDSPFIRKVLHDIFDSDPEIKVVGVAKNGREALDIAALVKPDVITLDIEMPVMNGLDCLKRLLKQGEYAVIMISAVTTEGAKATIEALNIGAVDFITKPSNIFQISTEEKRKELIQKVKIAKEAGLINLSKKADIKKKQFIGTKAPTIEKIIAIGTSTGGPRALQRVIPFLPGDLPAAVVVVQHMPQGFTRSLASRLNDISEMTVKEAEDKELMKAGFVYIAPGDRHLLLTKRGNDIILRLDESSPVSGHRPSFDKTLFSMSKIGKKNIVGVIMTGMGTDGSKGLKVLKEKAGIRIIAQDEQSCIVYGMPRTAIEMGIVDKVVPLEQIPVAILNYMGVRDNGHEPVS